MILDGFVPDAIATGAGRVRAGELLGMPTETVYGLAADAENDAVVAQIFKTKGRPTDHPLIVHVADASCVAHFAAEVPEFARQLMTAFWPGPLTLILPRRPGVAIAAAGGQNSIGLRCPSHPVAQALLLALRQDKCPVWGLAAPSANQFGRVSPTTARHVEEEFGSDLLILDGGACSVGIESTIIDCTRGLAVLLRPGAITPDQVLTQCGLRVLSKEELVMPAASAPRASGSLESHYAPRARVRLMSAHTLQTALDLLGPDAPGAPCVRASGTPLLAIYARARLKTGSTKPLYRRMPDDAVAAARELFGALREFDAQGVQLIWIENPPDSTDWDGVRDRLERAAAH